ncbi:hypothetical protein NX761_11650 [Nitrosomonas sp. PLL12]|nr:MULTISPECIES: hypothetical protein [Nitrosomonas]UVS60172.1 hypothetical protein NX761_11650 [Nitrosomonas sp. PLL12]
MSCLNQVENGNFSNDRTIETGLIKLRYFLATAFMYYPIRQQHIILLLVYSNKSGQERDIKKRENTFKILGGLKMTIRTRHFNIPAHLETDEDIRKFLRKTTHSGVASDFILALKTAARARGMAEIAARARVS